MITSTVTRICHKKYIGKTGRSLKKTISEHCRALKEDNNLNALANCQNKDDHNFNLDKACMIKKENVQNKWKCQCLESTFISQDQTIKQWLISLKYLCLAESISRQNKILVNKYKWNRSGLRKLCGYDIFILW